MHVGCRSRPYGTAVLNASGPKAADSLRPLHTTVATGRGSSVIFKALLRAGADPTQLDGSGRNVLHAAIVGAASGKVVQGEEMAMHLISKAPEGKVSAKLLHSAEGGTCRTPLMLAVQCRLLRVVDALISRKADPNVHDASKALPIFCALSIIGG